MKAITVALILCLCNTGDSSPSPPHSCPQTRKEAKTWGLAPGMLGILGGSFVSQAEVSQTFPWMVSVYSHKDADKGCGNICGGALISPGVVLTAGHCVSNPDQMFQPFSPVSAMGVVSAFVGPIPSPGTKPPCTGKEKFDTEHKVKSVLRYPGFPVLGQGTDFGIIFLTECVNVTSYAKINEDKTRDGKGANATVLGWGNQFKGSEPHDPDPTGTHGDSICLKKITMPVHNGDDGYDSNCKKSSEKKSQDEVCMECNPTGPAAGDSGGPLVMQDPDGEWTIIGVVSGGDPYPTSPLKHTNAMFTRVAEKARWINEQIHKDPCAKPVSMV